VDPDKCVDESCICRTCTFITYMEHRCREWCRKFCSAMHPDPRHRCPYRHEQSAARQNVVKNVCLAPNTTSQSGGDKVAMKQQLANMRTCYDCALWSTCPKQDAAMGTWQAAWRLQERCPKDVQLVVAVICKDAVPAPGYRRRSPDWIWGHDEREAEQSV